MLGVTCAGAAVEPNAWRAWQQVVLSGILRFVGLGYHMHFDAIVRRLADDGESGGNKKD